MFAHLCQTSARLVPAVLRAGEGGGGVGTGFRHGSIPILHGLFSST